MNCKMLFALFMMMMAIGSTSSFYQSTVTLSALGTEYQPRDQLDLLQTSTVLSKLSCLSACNEQPLCRTLDFDSVSGRCRLFSGDLNTGSIISSSSSTSLTGSVRLTPSLFAPTHNQPCQTCTFSRYEVCSTNTSTCQCPPRSFWDGSMCMAQRYRNQSCSQIDACRSDLNLTCSTDCYGQFGSCAIGKPILILIRLD